MQTQHDPPHWTFDVATSEHDAVKQGVIVQRWSRVHVSRDSEPQWWEAAQVAALLACSIHGGMPTEVRHVY